MGFILVEDAETGEMFVTDEDLVSDEEGSNEPKEKIKYNEWIKDGNSFYPAKDTAVVKTVDPGCYSAIFDQNSGRYSAVKRDINLDQIVKLPNEIIDNVFSELELFWNKADDFKKAGFVHKRGIMLYGGGGTGKTTVVNQIIANLVEKGGIAFYIKSVNDLYVYEEFVHNMLRVIQPNTPVLTVIEDIDDLVERCEKDLLLFLDGDDQFEHNVVLATTNHIDAINDLLIRPSRFDWVIEVNSVSEDMRKRFLESKGIEGEELETWVKKSKDLTMAQLKELFISVKLLDNDMKAVLVKLHDQEKKAGQSTYKPKNNLGFGVGKGK